MLTYSKEILKTSKKPLIKLGNISVKYENVVALNNINCEINNNDFISIIGPNGAGKSTLIKLLTGLIKPSSGEIEINTNSIGYLPQTLNNRPNFPITVKEVIYTGFKKQHLFMNKKDLSLIDYWLDKMNILDYKNTLMGSLSGGQQQRVFLIRALISNPQLLILDEPTSALDPNFRDDFFKLIIELNKTGTTIILITHDINESLNSGKIMYLDQTIEFFDTFDSYINLRGNLHV